ncbi:Myb-like DNA-binding domain protein [Aspergillus clavatus NRRL 1]|uniref:Myb-like domain-containing protein n=1 Tax=Aspergillus clavatus (strain ATCC 1007 / CBS 513.65 / DSM 816 / NCTC 3887 / NRRL 1 / QM 1276 / 107) TaxID=344612 RepID=A1C460_ASPCL|nr:uncharacterized protein ACLA_058620 [Aspergillus clavatus NRRL 1]EAW15200.1 conserved hypothetical protein [Aspergillus clavatus NRRL 1]
MERPQKRPRLAFASDGDTEPDDIDLQEARAHNDLRLKSIFEGIFEKYGKDFTEVGDEIDLQTGAIVVNNGHLRGMSSEDDTGDQHGWLFEEENEEDGNLLASAMNYRISDITMEGSTHDSGTAFGGDNPQDGAQAVMIPSPAFGFDRSCEELQPHGADGADSDRDDDDDKSSVDSLLDTALCVQTESDAVPGNWVPANKIEAIPGKPKATAETSIQSQLQHGSTRAEPVESIWRVPEIRGMFSTPSINKLRQKIPLTAVRSASPLGAGSLWALPGTSRRNTDGKKGRSAKKLGTDQRKHEAHHSSPVLQDWSFAETPDGNESDDPLQEDYQPSPTPRSTINIRGKSKAQATTPSRTKDKSNHPEPPPSQQNPSRQLPPDPPHEVTEAKRPENRVSQAQPEIVIITADQDDPSIETRANAETEPKASPVTVQTPSQTRSKRTIMTPDEAKLIVRMRQIDGKKWKEILHYFPQKKEINLIQWNHTHWNERQANPPPLSRPWSKPELNKLRALKDQQGLGWSEIRAAFPGRSLQEVEFQLLCLWAESGKDIKAESNGP